MPKYRVEYKVMLDFYSKAFFSTIVVDKLYFRVNIKQKFVKYTLMKA